MWSSYVFAPRQTSHYRVRLKGDVKLSGDQYNRLKADLYEKAWIIDVRYPVNNLEHVLKYLARYTHRIAIANSRIMALKDGRMTFMSKNRKKNRTEPITI